MGPHLAYTITAHVGVCDFHRFSRGFNGSDMSHSHGFGLAPCACSGGGGTPDDDGTSLWAYIDHANVRCLGASSSTTATAATILRPLSARTAPTPCLCGAPPDLELLLFIPFTCGVKLKSLCLGAGPHGPPDEARLWGNREDIASDWDAARDAAATQELALPDDPTGDLWHPLRGAKWGNVQSLTVLLRGGGGCCVGYLGLKGEGSKNVRGVVMGAVYESRPQLADHPVRGEAGGSMGV